MAPKLGPSSTLLRAARKERERLERTAARIRDRQADLRHELEQLEGQLAELIERERVLDALCGDDAKTQSMATDSPTPIRGREVLKGAEIRERAARTFYLTYGAGQPMHYRRWLELLLAQDAVEIAGDDPAATFLTNLNRSPVVVRGPEPGMYQIDDGAPSRLRSELREREAELRDVTAVLARGADRQDDLRKHRNQLVSAVRRLERLIAEAERVLAPVGDGAAAPDLRAAA